ncbi:XRE family transcriptional regulator [Ktedonosporobacter rubrisoli]|uniref:XRE family transcriptional regulator n=2 Tax=Ktedonosporobacter rubrisoli TaxID=2509675 RepID=A0A4P6JZS3_KTERU|nr:XRE family transcriptional regulator [Ktedonosporobacter rubrisoli]
MRKAEIAAKIGISKNTMSRYIQGSHPVPNHIRQRFADVLGIPEALLFPPQVSPSPQQHLSLLQASMNPSGVIIQSEKGRFDITQKEEEGFMDPARRNILMKTVTAAAVFAGEQLAAPSAQELVERLSRIFGSAPPHLIDKQSVEYLQLRLERSWADQRARHLPPQALLRYLLKDLSELTNLLERSLPLSLRPRIVTITGATALLAGILSYEAWNDAQSQSFYQIAINAARETENPALEAVAWGWNSLLAQYSGHPEQALHYVQHGLISQAQVHQEIVGWLAAIEAELYATLGNARASLQALQRASEIKGEPGRNWGETFWAHFEPSQYRGYQGICYLRLAQNEPAKRRYVDRAQEVLQGTLEELDRSTRHRRPTLIVDVATTYALQDKKEQALQYALQAAQSLSETRFISRVPVLRLQSLQAFLCHVGASPTELGALDAAMKHLSL